MPLSLTVLLEVGLGVDGVIRGGGGGSVGLFQEDLLFFLDSLVFVAHPRQPRSDSLTTVHLTPLTGSCPFAPLGTHGRSKS